MSDQPTDPYGSGPDRAVRPLDDAVDVSRSDAPDARTSRRGPWIAGTVLIGILVIAGGALAVWRSVVGSPVGAADSIPADADVVITMDFLQFRDTDRIERFVAAFTTPMAEHGIIESAPDFDDLLAELDDEAEAELGIRLTESVGSWIGRSGAFAMWVPDAMFELGRTSEATPRFLMTVEVRDDDAARAFVDRLVTRAAEDGLPTRPTEVAGVAGHVLETADFAAVIAVVDGRLSVADSAATIERANGTVPSESITGTSEFQELSAALPEAAMVRFYMSSSVGTQATDAYGDDAFDSLFGTPFGGMMSTVALDDSGIVVRTAGRAPEGLAPTPGRWARDLPADTYGFVDVPLPERFLGDVADTYLDVLEEAGLDRADVEGMTQPVDQIIGMSLFDDLLPQFGGELLLAGGPAADGALPSLLGLDVSVLFGIGVADPSVVETAVDNALTLAFDQGVNVVDRGGTRVILADGTELFGLAVTDDAFIAATSPDQVATLVAESGALGDTALYRRIDGLMRGDGLVFFVNVAGIVGDFLGPDVQDVLDPLVSIAASYELDGDLQLTEFRIVVDY